MPLFLRILISFFDFCIPKDKNLIVFPCLRLDEWQGNNSFLFQYMTVNNPELKKELVIITSNHEIESFSCTYNDTSILSISSFSGIFRLFRAGTVIYHHGALAAGFALLSKRRVHFHINHGIHYKKVELALDPDSLASKNGSKVKTKWFCQHHSVSSHIDALSACAYYHIPLSKIKITGIPRNDLFNIIDERFIPEMVRDDIDKLKKIIAGRKVIAYAPTWREDPNLGAYQFSEQDVLLLDKFLCENDALFFYAGHPYLKNRKVPSSEFVIDFNAEFKDIQSLLYLSDILVTDYSSVWLDFLLSDKPIVGFCFDKDFYNDERGFLFDVDAIFPGEIVTTFEELLNVFRYNLSVNNIDSERYRIARSMFHAYQDGHNCQRITNELLSLSAEALDK